MQTSLRPFCFDCVLHREASGDLHCDARRNLGSASRSTSVRLILQHISVYRLNNSRVPLVGGDDAIELFELRCFVYRYA